jgi:hypothetical protein
MTLNVYKYLKKPVLIMFNIGDAAKDLAEMTDDDVLASAMIAIRNMYPSAPSPKHFYRTSWSKDQYAK